MGAHRDCLSGQLSQCAASIDRSSGCRCGVDRALCVVEPCASRWNEAPQRLSQGAAKALEEFAVTVARAVRRFRVASLCGHGACGGAPAAYGCRSGVDGEEHMSHTSEVWLVCISGCAAHVVTGAGRTRAAYRSRSLRNMPALP